MNKLKILSLLALLLGCISVFTFFINDSFNSNSSYGISSGTWDVIMYVSLFCSVILALVALINNAIQSYKEHKPMSVFVVIVGLVALLPALYIMFIIFVVIGGLVSN